MYKFYKKYNAFTLAELLISLAIIGLLTAVLMPIISNMIPDQNIAMAKRAFYTTETVVSNLINSECYPQIKGWVGFDDGSGYLYCKKWGKGKSGAGEKFQTLFADELDTKTNGISSDKKTITTKDGMVWTFSDSHFENNKPNSYIKLTVDVNGKDKGPNCGQSTDAGKCTEERKNGFDKFSMKILARGKVEIDEDDCWAILAVRTEKKLTGKEDITKACEELKNEQKVEDEDNPQKS